MHSVRISIALLLCLTIAACDVKRPTEPAASTAPTVSAERRYVPFDGIYSAPMAVGEQVVYLDGVSQNNIVALSSEGNVWFKYSDSGWFKFTPAPATPFVSVTGTPYGSVFAVDQSGQVWQHYGGQFGWVAVPMPGAGL